ncbi:MAG: hypothetical protein NTW33_11090, partial [Methanoregula sp.]|nr:hypothetical protein [Methanoregula sp.]
MEEQYKKNNWLINGGTFQKLRRKDKKVEITNHKIRWSGLTVCIAMRWYDKIVFAADKKVSLEWFSYEGQPKINLLAINAHVMASSNNSVESDEIILKTQNKF